MSYDTYLAIVVAAHLVGKRLAVPARSYHAGTARIIASAKTTDALVYWPLFFDVVSDAATGPSATHGSKIIGPHIIDAAHHVDIEALGPFGDQRVFQGKSTARVTRNA